MHFEGDIVVISLRVQGLVVLELGQVEVSALFDETVVSDRLVIDVRNFA